MRSARLLVAAALALGALAAVPSVAAPAPARLAGTTTVVATRSGSVDLDLDRDATVRLQKDGRTPDITVSGGGRLVYAALYLKRSSDAGDGLGIVRVTHGTRTSSWTSVSGTYYPRASSCPGSDPVPASVNGVYEPCTPSTPQARFAVLHQGHYHLRVMTDGAPLTVRITLRGLPGERSVRLTRTLASSVTPLHALDGVADRQVRAEATVRTSRTAWGLLALDTTLAEGATLSDQVFCRYAPGPAGPADYADKCPGGEPFSWGGALVVNPYRRTPPAFDMVGDELTPGTHRVGLSLTDDQGAAFHSGLLGLLEVERA